MLFMIPITSANQYQDLFYGVSLRAGLCPLDSRSFVMQDCVSRLGKYFDGLITSQQ